MWIWPAPTTASAPLGIGQAAISDHALLIEPYQIESGHLILNGKPGLGYALGVKNLSVINVEFYTGVDQRLEVPIMLPPTPARVDLSGLKVLIADDVADTGRTLELVHEFRDEAQLIIVSHQKRTMEAADCLYGVTMQPGGSSKVLSEKVSEPA